MITDLSIYLYLTGVNPTFGLSHLPMALRISIAPPVSAIFMDKSDVKLSNAGSKYLLATFLILFFVKSDLTAFAKPCRPNNTAAFKVHQIMARPLFHTG